MTTYATGCSENGVLRFSCKVTDFARYDKENFIFSCKVLSFGMKNAKEKLTLQEQSARPSSNGTKRISPYYRVIRTPENPK